MAEPPNIGEEDVFLYLDSTDPYVGKHSTSPQDLYPTNPGGRTTTGDNPGGYIDGSSAAGQFQSPSQGNAVFA